MPSLVIPSTLRTSSPPDPSSTKVLEFGNSLGNGSSMRGTNATCRIFSAIYSKFQQNMIKNEMPCVNHQNHQMKNGEWLNHAYIRRHKHSFMCVAIVRNRMVETEEWKCKMAKCWTTRACINARKGRV